MTRLPLLLLTLFLTSPLFAQSASTNAMPPLELPPTSRTQPQGARAVESASDVNRPSVIIRPYNPRTEHRAETQPARRRPAPPPATFRRLQR